MSTINNLDEFLEFRGVTDSPYAWARAFYKWTDCGPWVNFLMRGTPAKDIEHPDQTGSIRKKSGMAYLANAKQLSPDFVQFLGFDAQGLNRRERKWEEYNKLVDAFAADEAKQDRTGRHIRVSRPKGGRLLVTLPGYTEHVEATTTGIYYEDIGKDECEAQEVDCECRLKPAGVHPDDPQEELYTQGDPDSKCRKCWGRGNYTKQIPTGRKKEVTTEACVGLEVGSIVEGSDACYGPEQFMFPFESESFDKMLEEMAAFTSFFWERDNGQWYTVQDDDDEWIVVNSWGDISWKCDEGSLPSPEVKAAAEKAIEGDLHEEGDYLRHSIPLLPGIWKKQNPDWKAMELGVNNATIHRFENDADFY